jgi:hypothetical protein
MRAEMRLLRSEIGYLLVTHFRPGSGSRILPASLAPWILPVSPGEKLPPFPRPSLRLLHFDPCNDRHRPACDRPGSSQDL